MPTYSPAGIEFDELVAWNKLVILGRPNILHLPEDDPLLLRHCQELVTILYVDRNIAGTHVILLSVYS